MKRKSILSKSGNCIHHRIDDIMFRVFLLQSWRYFFAIIVIWTGDYISGVKPRCPLPYSSCQHHFKREREKEKGKSRDPPLIQKLSQYTNFVSNRKNNSTLNVRHFKLEKHGQDTQNCLLLCLIKVLRFCKKRRRSISSWEGRWRVVDFGDETKDKDSKTETFL